MHERTRYDLAIFWLIFLGCAIGAFLGGNYGFSELTNRADATFIGLLIGALTALLFYGLLSLITSSLRR